jgi:ParB family chromosome partitioning protein
MMDFQVKPVSILKSSDNPRKSFTDLDTLAASIKKVGILQPILIDESDNIIAGERRFRAAKIAGMKNVPCIVTNVTSSLESRELSFSENFHRVDLSSPEIEQFIHEMWEEGGPDALRGDGRRMGKQARYQSKQQLSEALGMPRQTVEGILESFEVKSDLEIAIDGVTYNDITETVALEKLPEQRKQVLISRGCCDIKKDDLRQVSEVIKKAPDLSEFTLELVKKGNSMTEIEQKVEFISKQDPKMKKDLVEMELYEPAVVPAVEVNIEKKDIDNMKNAVDNLEDKQRKMRESKKMQERNRLRKNWSMHADVLQRISEMFDPETGDDWTHLTWEGSGMTIQQAAGVARQKLEDAMK